MQIVVLSWESTFMASFSARKVTSVLYDEVTHGSYLGICYDSQTERLFFTNHKLYTGYCQNCTESTGFRYGPVPNINFTQQPQNRFLSPLALDRRYSEVVYCNGTDVFSFRAADAPIMPRAKRVLVRAHDTVINGLTVDSERQWLYWTERSVDSVGCNTYTIMRKHMDGSKGFVGFRDDDVEVLYEHQHEMFGIDIDRESNTLFFTCHWFKPYGAVYKIHLDHKREGKYIVHRITDDRITGFVGMPDVKVIDHNTIIYTDYGLRRVFMMDFDGNHRREIGMLDYYPFAMTVDLDRKRVFVTAEATFFNPDARWRPVDDERGGGIQCPKGDYPDRRRYMRRL